MMLWIAAALLLALTLGVLAATLLRAKPPAATRRDYDMAVYRDQLDEVERDVERGILAADQAEAARLEIKRRMLAATGDADGPVTPPVARGIAPAWRGAALALIVVLVPLGSIGLYLGLGSPGLPDQPLAARRLPDQATAVQRTEMEQLTARLAAQMEKQPDRVDGWLLLGRSLRTLHKYGEAAKAFERALALTRRSPEILSEYGELLVLAHGSQVPDPAIRVFEEALAADPAEPRARFYLGMAKAERGDARGAVQAWVDLIAVSPPDAPWLADVRRQIQATATAAGLDVAAIKPSPGLPAPAVAITEPAPAAPAEGAAMPGPSAEDVKAASQMSTEDRQAMIRSMVERLAERLKDNPDDAAGWRRLARAYEVLGEADKAKDALAKAAAAEKKATP